MRKESGATGLSDALVVHGLWQPVVTLRALSLALTQGWETQDDATRLRLARQIEGETERLRDLAEDLTTLAALDHGGDGGSPRPESVVDLLRDAAAGVGELDGRLRVRVEDVAGGMSVCTDRGRALRVLKAFLRQADVWSHEGGFVTLSASPRGDDVSFVVAADCDEAIDVSTTFDLAASRTRGEAPLGMYVARRLIEADGGRVETMREGTHASLVFRLPIANGAPR